MKTYKIDRIGRWWWIVLGILFCILILICIFDGKKGITAGIFLIVLYSIPLGIRLLMQKVLENRARSYIGKMQEQIEQTKTIEELEQIQTKLGKKKRYSIKRFVYDNGIKPRKDLLATLFCQKRENEVKEKLDAANQISQLEDIAHLMIDIDEFIEDTDPVYTYKESIQRLFSSKLLLLLSDSTSSLDFHQAFRLCLNFEEDFANKLFQDLRGKLSQTIFQSFPLTEPIAKGRTCYYKAPIILVIPKKNTEAVLEEYTLYVFHNKVEILSNDSLKSFLIRNVVNKRVSEGILHLLINNEKILFKGFPQIFILNRLIEQHQAPNI